MQAATLPAASGWQWILNGAGLFRRQPMAMFFWSLLTGFIITISYMVPVFGQIALIAMMPLLTFIALNACRHIDAGRLMTPGMWLEPVRDADIRKRLLRMGFAYLACCLVGGFAATLPFMDSLMAVVGDGATIDEAALIHAIRGPFIAFALIYVVISALFWHAPALAGWHRIKLGQALFFSMVACWRNKWAFLVYGLSWAAIFFGIQFLGSFMASAGLSASVVQIILTPANLIVAAILYCSFYPAYMAIFGQNYRQDEQDRPTLEQ